MRERRRDYELMIVISPLQANEEGIAATVERIKQSIETAGGELTGTNQSPPWGRRKLAYPIRAHAAGEASRRNFNEGYYVLLHFSLSAAQVPAVERTLKLLDPVIRYLITVVEPKPAAEAAEDSEAVAEQAE